MKELYETNVLTMIIEKDEGEGLPEEVSSVWRLLPPRADKPGPEGRADQELRGSDVSEFDILIVEHGTGDLVLKHIKTEMGLGRDLLKQNSKILLNKFAAPSGT